MKQSIFQGETIYIAGPECFYEGGFAALNAMRRYAESMGFGVTLPNDHPLDTDNPDKRKRADSIFRDLADDINHTTILIADLEAYRGSEPDSGTVYEIGMAYARGIRCYGYTRDKRPLACKDPQYRLQNGVVLDETGNPAPYPELPFSPHVVGSTKIVQGDFYDCLKTVMTDLEEEHKHGLAWSPRRLSLRQNAVPTVYIASPERYRGGAWNRSLRALCREEGLSAVTPLDAACDPELDSLRQAAVRTELTLRLLGESDVLLADLNDFRGYECSNDVAFECGAAFQLGRRLFGFMKDARRTIDRIPHFGPARENRDFTGSNVEDFDYAANLMFGSSMPIWQADAAGAIRKAAAILREGGK